MADHDEAHGDAVGDTHQVHDAIHPRDLPPGHPARPAAAEQYAEAKQHADEEAAEDGSTLE